MEVVINKVQSGRFKPGIFHCPDCNTPVERRGASHKRCDKCAKLAIRNVVQHKIERHFPNMREDFRWVATYLMNEFYYADKLEQFQEKRDLLKELAKPSACTTCSLFAKCANEKLMCKQYYHHVNSPLKNAPMGVGRREPKKIYYDKTFPNETKEERTKGQTHTN